MPVNPSPEGQLSAYEQIRLEHIRRNHEFMEKLGLFSTKEALNDIKPARKQKNRVVVPPLPEELCRRSSRIKKEVPQYTGEVIDQFGDACPVLVHKRKFIDMASNERKGDPEAEGDVEEDEAEIDYESLKDNMRVAAMLHMEEVRKALLPTAIVDEVSSYICSHHPKGPVTV